jgi:glutamine synthetase
VAEAQLGILEQLAEQLQEAKKKTDAMTEARKRANGLKDLNKKAEAYCGSVLPYFDQIRDHCDRLERLVSDAHWPLAKYRDLLFIK